MKSQEQIERKIKELEHKLELRPPRTIGWHSLFAKIVALEWVLKEDTYMGRKQNG